MQESVLFCFLPHNLHSPQFTHLNIQNNHLFKEKLLGKNNLICYNIECVNIFCAAVGQQR